MSNPMVRPILVTLYGAAIGGLCAVVVLFAFPSHPLLVFVPCVCAFGFLGFKVAQMPAPKGSPWLLLPLTPFMIAVVLVLMVVLAVVMVLWLLAWPFLAVVFLRKERHFRRRLQSQARLLTASDLQERLDSGTGTLIEEMGPKGTYRVWWTQDHLEDTPATDDDDQRVLAILRDEHKQAENLRRCQEYLDEHTGRALLAPIPARQARPEELTRRFPAARRVVILRW